MDEKIKTVYCHVCSKAGGANMPIYHEPPICGNGMDEKGLYQKYFVSKTSGKRLDPGFECIVLRIDAGQYVDACRVGVAAFAEAVRPLNKTLARDIRRRLLEFEEKGRQKMDEMKEIEEKLMVSSTYVQNIIKENNALLSKIKELENQLADRGKWTETYFKKWQETEARMKKLEIQRDLLLKDKKVLHDLFMKYHARTGKLEEGIEKLKKVDGHGFHEHDFIDAKRVLYKLVEKE